MGSVNHCVEHTGSGTMCKNDFGEDGKNGTKHVTFSSLAYYINIKGVTLQTKYEYGRENYKRDVAERRTGDAGMQEGTIECAC